MKDPQTAAPVSPSGPAVTDFTPPVPLLVLRDPTPDDAGAYLVPVPDALFWQKTRPHVLRVVSERPSGGPLLFIVRPEHADADRAALDAVLEKQGGPVPHVLRAGEGGKPITEWRLFPDHVTTVELVAKTPRPAGMATEGA